MVVEEPWCQLYSSCFSCICDSCIQTTHCQNHWVESTPLFLGFILCLFFFYYHHKFTFYISCSVLSVFCLDKSCKWVALAMEEGKCCQNQICTLKERWHECLVKGSWCIHQEKSATAWALHTLQKTMWSIKTLIWPRCVKGKKKKFMNSNLTFCRLWRQRHRIFSSPSTPYTTRYFMVLNYWRFLFLKIYILTDFPFMFQVSGVF